MIKFGTDGWRAVMSDDFTPENVRMVAQAYCNYLIKKGTHKKGIVVGYDNRSKSEDFAYESAKVAASNGINAFLTERSVPSPVVSFAVKTKSSAGGIMITASHNPPDWNGFKIKSESACSASREITQEVENELKNIKAPVVSEDFKKRITVFDPRKEYFAHLEKFVDFGLIKKAGINAVIDPMFGSGIGYVKDLLSKHDIGCTEIHGYRDTSFGGLNPEPIPLNLKELAQAVVSIKSSVKVGLATDGDADRIGGVDGKGGFLTSHDIFVLLLKHLVENKKMKGSVVKTFNITNLVGMYAKKHGLVVRETPIGFKYIADYMLKEDVLIGGEESGGIGIKGHIPERDGVLNSLLLLECMSYYKKDLRDVLDSVMDEFGYFFYDRIDVHLSDEQRDKLRVMFADYKPDKFAGEKVSDIQTLDGTKIYLPDMSWILFRMSGTEPLLRIYCEATSAAKVRSMLAEGRKIIK